MKMTRKAKFKFAYSERNTGKILLEGIVTGYNKTDCKNSATIAAWKAGIKPMTDDNIKFYITRS